MSLHILHVHIHVKPECLDAFREATLANARASIQEPGIACFDFCQRQDDPTRFVLVEAYRDPADHARHRETAHYAAWRAAADSMMAEPRTAEKLHNVFPADAAW